MCFTVYAAMLYSVGQLVVWRFQQFQHCKVSHPNCRCVTENRESREPPEVSTDRIRDSDRDFDEAFEGGRQKSSSRIHLI